MMTQVTFLVVFLALGTGPHVDARIVESDQQCVQMAQAVKAQAEQAGVVAAVACLKSPRFKTDPDA